MTYATKTARLRPVRAGDAKITVAWRNDPAVRDFALGYRYPVTLAMERRWYKKALAGDGKDAHFAIEDVRRGRLVGIVSLMEINLFSRHACFGIVIGEKRSQGRGIGRDATRLALRFAFGSLNLHRVYLYVPAYNVRARKLYRSLGFKREGVLRDHIFMGGQYHDAEIMGLLARAFPEARDQPGISV
ncbi:MAG: GNAT family N-acetyltransferase [Alphaproteobacteria bacterium]|nr:GNAT family N-acetyltransferase [Alphaproteobacteria bacterium]